MVVRVLANRTLLEDDAIVARQERTVLDQRVAYRVTVMASVHWTISATWRPADASVVRIHMVELVVSANPGSGISHIANVASAMAMQRAATRKQGRASIVAITQPGTTATDA